MFGIWENVNSKLWLTTNEKLHENIHAVLDEYFTDNAFFDLEDACEEHLQEM